MTAKNFLILDDNNKVEIYINQHDKVVFVINEDEQFGNSVIALDKEDVRELIKELKRLYKLI